MWQGCEQVTMGSGRTSKGTEATVKIGLPPTRVPRGRTSIHSGRRRYACACGLTQPAGNDDREKQWMAMY